MVRGMAILALKAASECLANPLRKDKPVYGAAARAIIL